MKKITLEFIKQEAEKKGWRLLSDKYINSRTKLTFQCSCGYIFKARYFAIYNFKKCPFCSKRIKITIEDIKKLVEAKGWILLSTEIKDTSQKFKCLCDDDIIREIHWGHFRANCGKPRDKITIERLNKIAKTRNLTLISTEYKNPKSKLTFVCNNGHEFTTSYESFIKSKGCPRCAKNKPVTTEEIIALLNNKNWQFISRYIDDGRTVVNCICDNNHNLNIPLQSIVNNKACIYCIGNNKHTPEKVKTTIEDKGWKLLSEYKSKDAKLTCECNNHHIIQTSFSRILSGVGCKYCNGGGRFDYDFVENRFKVLGFVLLEKEYKNNHTKMKAQCCNGHIVYVSLGHILSRKNPCPRCRINYSETLILNFLIKHTNKKWESIFPKWLKYKRRCCQLDLYCEELKIAIEIQGKQHYEYPNRWHSTEEEFNAQRARDEFKRQKCKEMGIALLEIRAIDYYKEEEKMIEEMRRLIDLTLSQG